MAAETYKPGLHRWSILLACATLLLVVAGGLVTSRDAGLSVPDWPLSYGKLMPPMEGGILYEHVASTFALNASLTAAGSTDLQAIGGMVFLVGGNFMTCYNP